MMESQRSKPMLQGRWSRLALPAGMRLRVAQPRPGHPRGCRRAVAAIPALLGADVRLGARRTHAARELAQDLRGPRRSPISATCASTISSTTTTASTAKRRREANYNWSYVDQIYDGLLARRSAVRRAELHAVGPGRLAETAPVLVQAAAEPAAVLREMGEAGRAFTRHLEDRYGAERSGNGTSRSGTSRTSTSGRASRQVHLFRAV